MLSHVRPLRDFLRAAVPVICLFGSAPAYLIFWLFLRAITAVCSSKQIYRQYDDYFYSLYQQFVLFFFESWVNVKIYFHGDYEDIFQRKENVLYIANHQSSVDWIVANMLAVRQGSLGHIRYVLKNGLRWIPLYGFYFQQHGCIYVRRNDKRDLERVEKGISQIKSNGLPVWLVIFPEGTRYNPKNNRQAIERSHQFAQEKGVVPFDKVLYPRTGATIAAINALKDKLDAVYDITVMYDDTIQTGLAAPSMIEYLQGKIGQLHIHIKRLPIDTVPTDTNDQISNWVYDRFVLKDKLLKEFDSQTGVQAQSSLNQTKYACLFFLLSTILLLLTSQGRSLYWQIGLFGTPLSLLWMYLFPRKELEN